MAANQCLLEKSLVLALLLVRMSLGTTGNPNGFAAHTTTNTPKLVPKPHEALPATMGVQGVVYCRTGSLLTPLQGAVVRVTCLAIDENEYESAPISLLSKATYEKGYFLAILAPKELERIAKHLDCKAFLDSSPSETCKVPSDVNKGTTGALLRFPRQLFDKNMKLYSVGPFVYDHEPHSDIDHGY